MVNINVAIRVTIQAMDCDLGVVLRAAQSGVQKTPEGERIRLDGGIRRAKPRSKDNNQDEMSNVAV